MWNQMSSCQRYTDRSFSLAALDTELLSIHYPATMSFCVQLAQLGASPSLSRRVMCLQCSVTGPACYSFVSSLSFTYVRVCYGEFDLTQLSMCKVLNLTL